MRQHYFEHQSPNIALQRTGIDKVPVRGRMPTAPLEINHARVLMRWRAVAERGR